VAELKTKVNAASVDAFLRSFDDPSTRADCKAIASLMQQITKAPPKMWGKSIVGFGQYRYRYASGREGDWFLTGFSPRKQNMTVYVMGGFKGHEALLETLGKYRRSGGGCLYFKRLDDLHVPTLRKLIQRSVQRVRKASAAKQA
jgi:Domain of unknown function (DU1801)